MSDEETEGEKLLTIVRKTSERGKRNKRRWINAVFQLFWQLASATAAITPAWKGVYCYRKLIGLPALNMLR